MHPSDTAVAFVALDAEFDVQGPSGARSVKAGEFFVPPRVDLKRENVLEPGELLVGMTLPAEHGHRRGAYKKLMDREAWTHAVVSCALTLDMNGKVCRDARLVLGGVAPIPWRLAAVEDLVRGQKIDDALAARAGEAAVAGAQPLTKNGYKVTMVRALVRRTLLELLGSA